MNDPKASAVGKGDLFGQAERYDQSINWAARLARELPVLIEVFGPPGEGGLLDAGCGTGHQAGALAKQGYHVVGADAGEGMLAVARRLAESAGRKATFVLTPYAELLELVGGGFDGVYCVGNSLAAAGSRDAVREAIVQFAQCLRPGGRLFIQTLNFAAMRAQEPCVRGPRVSWANGREYISTRHYQFLEDHVRVTNVTLWHRHGWHQRSHSGRLYAVSAGELQAWCARARLRVDEVWGSYAGEPLDLDRSTDLLLAATRT